MTEVSKNNRNEKYPKIVQPAIWGYDPKFFSLYNDKSLELVSNAPHQTCTLWVTFSRVKKPSFF